MLTYKLIKKLIQMIFLKSKVKTVLNFQVVISRNKNLIRKNNTILRKKW